jgi:hypothetical protein
VVDVVIETAVAELTLAGANATEAVESELETVPPLVGEISVVGGGDRPLAVFAVGSGGAFGAFAGVVPLTDGGVTPVDVPTMTLTVPVPVLLATADGV